MAFNNSTTYSEMFCWRCMSKPNYFKYSVSPSQDLPLSDNLIKVFFLKRHRVKCNPRSKKHIFTENHGGDTIPEFLYK